MTQLAKKIGPQRQKLLKRYGEKILDWTNIAKTFKAFKDTKPDAAKLRKEAWNTGNT